MNTVELYKNSYDLEQRLRTHSLLKIAKPYMADKDVLDFGIGDGISLEIFKSIPKSYDILEGSLELIQEMIRF